MQEKSYNPVPWSNDYSITPPKLGWWHRLRLWWIRRQFDKRGTKAQREVLKLLNKTIYKKFTSPGRVV